MYKPVTIDKYWEWLKDNFSLSSSSLYERYYNTVMTYVENQFCSSDFWNELSNKWDTLNQEYFAKTNYNLFAEKLERVYIKPYESMVDKTFRKNILLNNDFPNEPKNGWIYPDNPFEQLNDLLRTTIIVKYLDGAEFILEKLREFAEKSNYEFRSDYEAKDKGYYAIHAYIRPEFEVPDINWDTKKIHLWIEIQITTQIQDTIKKLTHKYYEKRRSSVSDDKLAWQWNYKSDEFSINYMGHILHYLEGMIMEIRDKNGGRDAKL